MQMVKADLLGQALLMPDVVLDAIGVIDAKKLARMASVSAKIAKEKLDFMQDRIFSDRIGTGNKKAILAAFNPYIEKVSPRTLAI